MTDIELAGLRTHYRDLQDQIRELGFIAPGSVIERYTACGSPGCRCHADPPARHGPYYQYTRKLAGKTLTRRLDPAQVQLYREWIANRRHLDRLLAEMDNLSRQAAELLITRPPDQHSTR
ncbi:MAG: hypothetical protein M3Z25_24150 [Actinomycetota bacterium]|nr:hypothetical protein [Actinomycetota bacterium]